MGSGGTTTARLKLEGIDGRAHQGWSLWLNLNQHGETYQDQISIVTACLKGMQDIVCGGAWPLVVRGLTCHALIQLTSETTAFYETMARYGVETNNRLLMSYEEIFS